MATTRIDLHIHTTPQSRCSALLPEEAIQAAKDRGLDGICFTEHNRLWEIEPLQKLADQYRFLLLRGIEVDTPLGHILVYGLTEPPGKVLDIRNLREQVEEAGGIMVAAHPFRNPIYATAGYGLWDPSTIPVEIAARREIFRWVDAIEISADQDHPEEAELTLAVSRHLGMSVLGGSDAHRPEEVGSVITLFEKTVTTEADLILALKTGKVRHASA